MNRQASAQRRRWISSGLLVAMSALSACANFASDREPRLCIVVVGADPSVPTHGGQLGKNLMETAQQRGWSTDLEMGLVGQQATCAAVRKQLRAVMSRLRPGTEDTLFLYVAGKGRCEVASGRKRLFVELAGPDAMDLEVLANQLALLSENRAMIVLDAEMQGTDGATMRKELEELSWAKERHAVWLTSDPTRRIDVVHNGIDLTAVLSQSLADKWHGDQGIDFRAACDAVQSAAAAKRVPMEDAVLMAPQDAVMFRRSGIGTR